MTFSMEDMTGFFSGITLSEPPFDDESCLSLEEETVDEGNDVTEIPLTKDGLVTKRILKSGHYSFGKIKGRNPSVSVHYTMQVVGEDDAFDETHFRGGPETLSLGDTISGMGIGIRSMKRGEVAIFYIHPSYGFGRFGCPPRIPPQAQLKVTVELVDFFLEGTAANYLSTEPETREVKLKKIMIAADKELELGIRHFKETDNFSAMKCFSRGANLLLNTSVPTEREEHKLNKLLIKLLLNEAKCQLSLNSFEAACVACRRVLDIDPKNVKAMFRFARAKRYLEDLQCAKDLLQRASRLSERPEVFNELAKVTKELDEYRKSQSKK